MKKSWMTLAFAVLAGLALAGPAGAADPKRPGINPADLKRALKKAVDVQIVDFGKQFPRLTLANPCTTEFNAAVREAVAEHAACLDINNPPAGSPLAVFNALSHAALAEKCTGQTLDQCIAPVLRDQQVFCARERGINVAKARSVLNRCCGPLSQRKAELQRELAAIEADVQSCLGR